MIKFRYKLMITSVLVVTATVFGLSVYYKSLLPKRSGHVKLKSLEASVKIDFDDFGVPHIKAENEKDALRALGYLQAQDRLFQMEMIRRVGYGELSEVAGYKTLEIDKLFRSLNLVRFAKNRIKNIEQISPAVLEKAQAFVDGINQYQRMGPRPLEFEMMGIDNREFSIEDIYVIFGYLSFSFDKAFKTDILLSKLKRDLSGNYLKDLDIANTTNLFSENILSPDIEKHLYAASSALESLPRFDGSNARG